VLNQLDVVRERYVAGNATDEHAWLFSSDPKHMGPFGHDWEARHKAISEAQYRAIESIYTHGGLQSLLNFACIVDQPDELGRTMGWSELLAPEEDVFFHHHVRSVTPAHRILARAYVIARANTRGWEWIEEKVKTVVREQLSSPQQSEFFQFLPFAHRTWELLTAFADDVQQLYWTEIEPRGLLAEDYEEAVGHLLQYERPYAAFYITANRLADIPPDRHAELVADVLERFVLGPGDPKLDLSSLGYHISNALAYIEASGVISEEHIARLEWLCLPALEYGERGPRVLHREMARNPQFFLELLAFIYRAADEEPKKLTPEEQLRNRRAYDLVKTWHDMPGIQEDGSLHVEVLTEWVTEVRTAARAVARLEVADISIGEVLARSPKDSDGTWPSVVVRNIIEEVGSEELEQGFMIYVFNSRGVFTKSLGEGGSQERELAAKYRGYAELLRTRWPRTAAILHLLAERYAADAREADLRAELEEDILL
jgi:hypothetical protein